MKIKVINKSKHKLPAYSTLLMDGERIYQMIITIHEKAQWDVVDNLLETERGAGGFGHTGKE